MPNDAEQPTPRQLAWLLRHGEELTLEEVGKRMNRSREWVRTLTLQVEGRLPMCWRSNRPPSSMPAWWWRLRYVNAFRSTTAGQHEPARFKVPKQTAGEI